MWVGVRHSATTAAAGFRPLGRDRMGLGFELAGERLERRRLAVTMRERLRQQPIGEPGIPGEERPMEVRAERTPDATALPATLAVVAEPGYHAAERLRTRVEASATRAVLEASQRTAQAGRKLARE